MAARPPRFSFDSKRHRTLGLHCERFERPQRADILSGECRYVNKMTPKRKHKFKKIRACAGLM
jgi:hypothetical protein